MTEKKTLKKKEANNQKNWQNLRWLKIELSQTHAKQQSNIYIVCVYYTGSSLF
jgi:hypothetical protein